MTDESSEKPEERQLQPEDDYELPPGIIFPEGNASEYPAWRKGIIAGFVGGICGAFFLGMLRLTRVFNVESATAAVLGGFMVFFVMAGSIAAFRPPKN
ncbi:MAG: hypothetical protein PHV59_11795 [Victivallales bacterium]|nr:hypothetical protein [Victivallales bacterium]